MKNRLRLMVIGIAILACNVLLCFTVPSALEQFAVIWRYIATTSERSDYTKITTPLPQGVAEDVCAKFELESNDDRCLPGAIVYGPDFFGDIKEYFRNLPGQEATLQVVEDKLGAYFVGCENPNAEGRYRCQYDLRGDGLYPISIFFTEDGFIYRIMANTGNS